MDYKKVEGIYKYRVDPDKEAVGWQGYDDFPGIDKYENRILEKETILVKLHGTKSGYFTTFDTYERLKKNGKVSAIELSEGLQIAPWKNKGKSQYEYRSKVSFVRITEQIEVAYGKKHLLMVNMERVLLSRYIYQVLMLKTGKIIGNLE